MHYMLIRKRLITIIVLFVLVASAFAVRLVEVQVVNGRYYYDIANKSSTYTQEVTAARGNIVDRNGVVLAGNRMGFNVVLDKNFLPDDYLAIVLQIKKIMAEKEEKITDSLPITYGGANFLFEEGREDDVAKLKTKLGLQSYATIDDVMAALISRYQLEQYTGYDLRTLAGVCYDMQLREFSNYTTFTLATDVSMDTVTKIKENSMFLPGVTISEETVRTYPQGDLAAQVIGVTGLMDSDEWAVYKEKGGYSLSDYVGKFGLEYAMESVLKGVDGSSQVVKDKNGSVLQKTDGDAAVAGNTVVLTIDSALQRVTQTALQQRIEEIRKMNSSYGGTDAQGAAAVVINVKTGEILAIASYPSYDLSTYYQNFSAISADTLKPLTSRATTGQYSVGSSFKPVVALGAANEGIINRSTSVYCSGVYTYFEGYSPKCGGVHGATNVISALKVSCNTYFYEIGRRLGIDNIVKYASGLGFGQATGIEVPEKTGTLSCPALSEALGKTWYAGNVIQAAIGQLDTTATPLQLAVYAAALANNGTRYQAHLVKTVTSFDQTEVIEEKQPTVLGKLDASEDAFAMVREGMVAASHSGGTSSSQFNTYSINVASKTGTPQTSSGSNSGTYICYGPAEDPEIAIAIVGEHVGGGFQLAAVAKAIMNQYFYPPTSDTASSDTASTSSQNP